MNKKGQMFGGMFGGSSGSKFRTFKTRSAAGAYANMILRKYGFNASVFELRKGGKVKYGVLEPKSAGLVKIR